MNNDRNRRALAKKGFTLLELIVVITIIGLLGTLVVTKVAPILFRANKTKIISDQKTIYNTAKIIYTTSGGWPESIDEMVNPVDEDGNELEGLEEMPRDPWGNEYEYELRDGKPVIICLGRDANTGGEGDDQDYEYPETDEY
ncbi:MAG: type II secretion system protein GspG [Planctomycetota bacterium]|mgnify:FL=1|nr:type II secretion system protein GspG [Planctomycetota bacterium]MBL05909.1 type II secretion system protein GspG [Planctomycetota bacterium]MEE3053111.1 type II secretion system protein GspG [Planctomycetota bacterium]|tara:strand:- start:192 stop:617 length:426 start_codon:yes stop_codon:yes gene_type:complete